MSACDLERVEAWQLGGLCKDEEAEVAIHLGRCSACAQELAALRAEQSAFAARARVVEAVPQFEAVLLASRAPRPQWAQRSMSKWLAVGLSAAAALAVVVLARPPVADGAGGACFPADESVASAELTQASEESRFSECLLASPVPGNHCF